MSDTFVPLELNLIDEGMFVQDLNKALRNLQGQVIRHARQYGHKAEKSKAQLKAEITLICLDPEQETFGCVSQIKVTLPSAPASASMLMAGLTQTNENALMCRTSGTTPDHPQQRVFATLDGRGVDTETGAIQEDTPDDE